MAKDTPHKTHYTRQIEYLLSKVYGHSAVKDSLLDRTVDFFEHEEFRPSEDKKSPEESDVDQLQRIERYSCLSSITSTILELAEGDSFTENNKKSSQFLGTVQLLSFTEGTRVANSNEQSKAIYKAVLCIRLLDQLVIEGKIEEPYVKKYLNDITPKQYLNFAIHDREAHQRFIAQVKAPLIMAALLQDIGNYHPKAQSILKGRDGKKDPFRTLEVSERKQLLQINYRETIKYITEQKC